MNDQESYTLDNFFLGCVIFLLHWANLAIDI